MSPIINGVYLGLVALAVYVIGLVLLTIAAGCIGAGIRRGWDRAGRRPKPGPNLHQQFKIGHGVAAEYPWLHVEPNSGRAAVSLNGTQLLELTWPRPAVDTRWYGIPQWSPGAETQPIPAVQKDGQR